MTLMLIEETLSEAETVAQQFAPTVKCGWCGEIIRLDGNELALAMCQACIHHSSKLNHHFNHFMRGMLTC